MFFQITQFIYKVINKKLDKMYVHILSIYNTNGSVGVHLPTIASFFLPGKEFSAS